MFFYDFKPWNDIISRALKRKNIQNLRKIILLIMFLSIKFLLSIVFYQFSKNYWIFINHGLFRGKQLFVLLVGKTSNCQSLVPHAWNTLFFPTCLMTIVLSSFVLRRENNNNYEISHFPVSKQTVKVQFSLDVLGKIFFVHHPLKVSVIGIVLPAENWFFHDIAVKF